jgi:hypothetical protein
LTVWERIQRQLSNFFLPPPLFLHPPPPPLVCRVCFLPELKTLLLLPLPEHPPLSLLRRPPRLPLTIFFMTLKTLITKPSAGQCTGLREPRVAQISLRSSARQNNVRAYYRLATIKTSATKLHHHYLQVQTPTRRQIRLRDTAKGLRLHPLDIPCQSPLQQPCRKASYRSPVCPPIHPAALSGAAQVLTTGV